MKKVILSALFGGLLLSACSSEEPAMNNEQPSLTQNLGYVAVNISQPTSMSTRAASEGFEYGTEDENEAKSARFYIFKNDGTLNNSQLISLSGTGTNNNPEVERMYNAVLVIDGVSEKPSTTDNYQIVCVLNPPTTLTGKETLQDLRNLSGEFGTAEAGKFIMSNTVYKNGDNEVCGAIITSDNIKQSAAEANANPVEIYVERVVAKIRTNKAAGENYSNSGTGKLTINGEESDGFGIRITGFEVANIAKTSNLIKNLGNFSATWEWNNTTNKRSFWEVTPETEYRNKAYDGIAKTDFNWDNFSAYTEYVQPNTGNTKTAVLVTAQLMNGENPADLVWMKGGYFDNSSALNMICQLLANQKYAVKETTDGNVSYRSIEATDLVWAQTATGLKDYQAVAQVSSNITIVEYDFTTKEEKTPETSVNDYLCDKTDYFAEVFKDGKCYYYVNIDHSGVVTGSNAGDGVVRNHIYDLTINSIEGVGTAVFDPTKTIIPEEPNHDEFHYLAAKVNVLAWKQVTQDVNFGKKK